MENKLEQTEGLKNGKEQHLMPQRGGLWEIKQIGTDRRTEKWKRATLNASKRGVGCGR